MEAHSAARWEALFDDLAMQWEAAEAAEVELELADRSRREVAFLRLIDRHSTVPTRAICVTNT